MTEVLLRELENDQLLISTHQAVERERLATAEVVKHFREIQNRKLYLDYGFSTLFEMATQYFGYCAGSAQLRINSMRLLNEVPEIEAKLESGELNLSTAASVQRFFYHESQTKTAYSKVEKLELIETLQGKSIREVTQELAKRSPEILRRETTRHVTEDRVSLNFTISNQLNEKINRLKAVLSHSNPNMKNEDLLERLTELGLEKFDPIRKAKRKDKRSARAHTHSAIGADAKTITAASPNETEISFHAHEIHLAETKSRSRDIPAAEDMKAWLKHDGRGCEFVSSKTGRRCGSVYLLQRDHVQPFSYGGANTTENLRVYCAAHNRWAWGNRTNETSTQTN